jgi:hypothetical protein
MEGMLIDVVIFLAAALIAVPLSIRLGFGSVLGYLLAGVAIGPWVLRLITDVDAILHFSELGIVLMMFVIGLEMQVEKLWAMRRTIFGYGGDDLALACHTCTMYGRLLVVKQSGFLLHWVEIAAMYPGSVRSVCYGPRTNIREWVPHHNLGLGCPWCKAGLAHQGPTVLSSNLSLLKQPPGSE